MGAIKHMLQLALVLALVNMIGALSALAGSFNNLPGRWSGWGTVLFDGGETEKIKCIATYFLKDSGRELTQNLRCTTSASYKISAQSKLIVDGSKLNGTWYEKKNNNEGTVTGRMTRTGFKLSVVGLTFTAKMSVSTTGCNQTVKISPKGLGVRRIKINLGKC